VARTQVNQASGSHLALAIVATELAVMFVG
jgi:hypothetical protein